MPPTITADGTGVVSHAGTVLLAELADRIGLTAALSEATDGLRKRWVGYDRGRVLVDVAVAIAYGTRVISDVPTRPTRPACSVRPGRSPRPRPSGGFRVAWLAGHRAAAEADGA